MRRGKGFAVDILADKDPLDLDGASWQELF